MFATLYASADATIKESKVPVCFWFTFKKDCDEQTFIVGNYPG
jgi:hypothetical protein